MARLCTSGLIRRILAGVAVISGPVLVFADAPGNTPYRSPYSVKFTLPVGELLEDIDRGARGDAKCQSNLPFADWYTEATRERYGSWGPPAFHYPAPENLENRSLIWKRERVIAVALHFRGYSYQHHHIPDWAPPTDWPSKEIASGHNGKGVDCSNFSSFVYNLGFGIKLNSDIRKQADRLAMSGPSAGQTLKAEKIKLPDAYLDFERTLRTGDLVFIRNQKGEISHVVIWVGSIGKSPKNTPLIIDSHGQGVKDSEGVAIPDGVQLRPFREKSWYFRNASHAHRIWKGP